MPTSSEIYAALDEIFRDVFMREDIQLTPKLSAADVAGWDSLKQIEIVVGIEERFGIRLHTRDLDGLRNVGDLVSVIVRTLP